MCGRLNVIDDDSVVNLCEQLGLDLGSHVNQHQGRFIRATQHVEVILRNEHGIQKVPAIWWLLLDRITAADGEVTFKPSRYTSFNTRVDKLNVPRSAGYQSFRHQRCVVLVKGFGESQKTASGMQYTDFIAEQGECIALAGLYRIWQPGNVRSFSIITTAAHPKLAPFHQKASPLILNQQDDSLRLWLDPSMTDVEQLMPLLEPSLPQHLKAQPIDKPGSYQPIAQAIAINQD